jgi:DNA-binding NarL/FixJ family response regulator
LLSSTGTLVPVVRVFIVEDSPMQLKLLEKLLSGMAGIQLVGSSGEAGRATHEIHSLDPDVVILDIELIGGSGIDVLKNIRSNKPSLPVVIVYSSQSGVGFKRACLRLGADFVFDKSRDYVRLAETLRAIGAKGGDATG